MATGLNQPTAVAFLPDRRMLVTEKGGRLVLIDGAQQTGLITIPVCTASEMGLLGVAVDPGFATNGFVYLYRTKPAAGGCAGASGRFNQVVRITISNDAVAPSSLTELLTGIRTDNGNHDGGGLRIGPDGKLWVSVGDTGNGDVNGPPGSSTNPYAQDLGALEGKVLRLELSGAPAAGNPFLGTSGARPEVFAYGLRNPFRFGFDPVTGRPWLGDVGQNSYEELDIVQAGGNYAWPHCEGVQPPGCQHPGDIDPIFTYPLSGAGSLGRTIIGGGFAPAGFGPFAGDYFFGDYSASKLYRTTPNAARDGIVGTPTDFITNASGPDDIVFGPGDALYYVAINSGEVRQVTAPYPRPGGGTPLQVPLAPAFDACTTPNSAHVAPLDQASCAPPVLQSSTLTTSTAGRGAGSLRLDVVPGNPATPADEADIRISVRASDVRCAVANAACPGGAGSDFGGRLATQVSLRITDRLNGRFGSHPGTTSDWPWKLPLTCVTTPDPAVGSTCSLSSTADTLMPGFAREGVRTLIDAPRPSVIDPGPNGTGFGSGCPPTCGDGDEAVFLRQALFAP